jgi:hypothetical protein
MLALTDENFRRTVSNGTSRQQEITASLILLARLPPILTWKINLFPLPRVATRLGGKPAVNT